MRGPNAFGDGLLFGVAGKNETHGVRMLLHHFQQKLGPAHPGHAHIGDNDVKPLPSKEVPRLAAMAAEASRRACTAPLFPRCATMLSSSIPRAGRSVLAIAAVSPDTRWFCKEIR